MSYPLVWLVGCFALGIGAENFFPINFLALYLCAGIFFALTIIFFPRRRDSSLCLLCAMFFLGAAVLSNSRSIPKNHLARLINYQAGRDCRLKGYICSPPESKRGETSFLFQAEEAQFGGLKYYCRGRALVKLNGRVNFAYADRLLLKGRLFRPYTKGPGAKTYRSYLSRQGVFCLMRVPAPGLAKKLGTARGAGIAIKQFALWLKGKMEKAIFKYLSALPAGIVDAMLLGERRGIPLAVSQAMMRSGTMHILVVSGFNTGIVVFIIGLALKLMRLPRKARPPAALPVLILYCLMTGASTPVLRATVMAIVFMFAYYFRREADIYNSCAAALLFVLAVAPEQLFDLGAQLSFVSVLSIVWLYPRIKKRLRADAFNTAWMRFLLDGCLVSLSAWLGTMGLSACYFRIFAPVTVLANFFIVPLAALITLGGFSLIFAALALPPAAPFFAASLELTVSLLLKANAFLLKIPGAYFYLG